MPKICRRCRQYRQSRRRCRRTVCKTHPPPQQQPQIRRGKSGSGKHGFLQKQKCRRPPQIRQNQIPPPLPVEIGKKTLRPCQHAPKHKDVRAQVLYVLPQRRQRQQKQQRPLRRHPLRCRISLQPDICRIPLAPGKSRICNRPRPALVASRTRNPAAKPHTNQRI